MKINPDKKHNFSQVPNDLCRKCPKCKQIMFTKVLIENLTVCPLCHCPLLITPEQRIEMICDGKSFKELFENIISSDPINFPGYREKITRDYTKTGRNDGMVVGKAKIEGLDIVLCISEFPFMGGSMGSVSGEKVSRAIELGITEKLPVIIFTASGGARMQEGLLSLMQMAKTAAYCHEFDQAVCKGIAMPLIVVYTDPTTAGVYASYASLGDFIFSEPKATVGFAGKRVSSTVSHEEPPPDFQTAEFQLRTGHIDSIIERKNLRSEISFVLKACIQGGDGWI